MLPFIAIGLTYVLALSPISKVWKGQQGITVNSSSTTGFRKTKGPIGIHLRLLATSDLHMHILPFDYYAGTPTDRLGLARTASLIAKARAEVRNCLLFDNGDFLQGSPMGTYLAQRRGVDTDPLHPIFAAMNHLGYDAGTLGNHEFNYGLDYLEKALSGAGYPIVSANVSKIDGGTSLVRPYVILDRSLMDDSGNHHSIKIGVIGFTPPQILIWDHWHLAGKLLTRDIIDAASQLVPQMKADGADLIIALSHSGIGEAVPLPDMENASTALAGIEGIDAIIAGHSHLVFPSQDFTATPKIDPSLGTLCGKPAVMPGFNGSHLGVIDLFLSVSSSGYKLRSHKAEARPIWHRDLQGSGKALVRSDPELIRLTESDHQKTLNWMEQPIGTTPTPLHSYFALVADAPALQLVAAAQISHARQSLAATPFADLPMLASVAPFKAGGRGGPENYTDVPMGVVKRRNAADLYMHPNTSAAIMLTGAEIADWLEISAGQFNQIIPGSTDTPLVDTRFPSFNFEMLFGLTYQIDLAKASRFHLDGTLLAPDSHRIVNLKYQGADLDTSASFVIATNSYRIAARSVGQNLLPGKVIFRSTETILDLVQTYFADNPVASPVEIRPHRFVAMPGTTVSFDSAPKAVNHLREMSFLKIEPLNNLPNGFLRFRLHL